MAAGTRLGPYEILSPLGAGGMGEVYKARDTRLDRTVAIKVLPATSPPTPSCATRFEREARTIAALDHPHICTLHDVGRQDGTDYLVMEYLEGETLAQRLAQGRAADRPRRCRSRSRDRRRARRRASRRHRPPRPEARQRHADASSGAKLLDFGLAKLPRPDEAASAPARPATLARRRRR